VQDAEFSDKFCSFLQAVIPTVDTAELILLLGSEPATRWDIATIVARLASTVVLDAREALALLGDLESSGLAVRDADDRWQYRPQTEELGANVELLRRAYAERPVTLVRIIYSLRNSRIKSFAEAFRIWKR
jgi:hypothetical protein